MVDIKQIHCVIAAAELKSFRRAAQFLRVQQSAVSKRVRDLEGRLGAMLFVRTTGGVELTEAGKYFVVHARKVLVQLDATVTFAKAMGRGELGVIRLGLFSSLASGFLADLIRSYAFRQPGIRLDCIEGSSADHLIAVQRHELDVAFVTGSPVVSGCQTVHLWDERVFVVLPSGHEIEGEDEVSWSDLRGRNFVVSEAEPGLEIRDCLIRNLSDLGYRPSIEQCSVHRDNLMQLVALGRGLTLTSEATTAIQFAGVTYRPLATPPLPFSAVWSSTSENPALRPFLDLARAMSEERLNPKAP